MKVRIVFVAIALAASRGGAAPPVVSIAAVQGAGHISPLVGRRVSVSAIVTVVDRDPRRPGFWMQSAAGDGDPATSEGLRVDTAGAPALDPGNVAAVEGVVAEAPDRTAELRVTRLVDVSWRVLERGRALPAAVVLSGAAAGGRAIPSAHVDDDRLTRFEPDRDAIDFFESLEGMRVEIAGPIVVGSTTSYRDFAVLADAGSGAALRSWRGGLVARPGDDDPERIVVDPRLLAGEVPRVGVGDTFAGALIGVVDYGFGLYRVLATEPPPAIARRSAPRDRTALRGDDTRLTIATWNVLDVGMDDDDGVFRGVARALVEDLGAPDLVALQEIQDASGRRDDGAVAGAPAIERLIGAVRAAGGPSYEFLQIDPIDNQDGGAPGANIRVALLYDPSRVAHAERPAGDASAPTAVLPGPSLSLSPGRVDPSNEAWRESRKPLAVELRFADRALFVIANHFASKLGDDPAFGATQPPVPWSERQRRAQAEVVAGFVESLFEADPRAAVVVLGDLNEHWFGAALDPLRAAGLEPLVERVPLEERYTYNYRGLSQVLDHVFVSPALAAGAEVDVVHTNADFPAWRRASDHDAVVARLRFGRGAGTGPAPTTRE